MLRVLMLVGHQRGLVQRSLLVYHRVVRVVRRCGLCVHGNVLRRCMWGSRHGQYGGGVRCWWRHDCGCDHAHGLDACLGRREGHLREERNGGELVHAWYTARQHTTRDPINPVSALMGPQPAQPPRRTTTTHLHTPPARIQRTWAGVGASANRVRGGQSNVWMYQSRAHSRAVRLNTLE